MHQEIELKFAIAPTIAMELLLGADMLGARKRKLKQAQFQAVYFDTPRYRLRHMGIDFRIKRTDGDLVQTVKLPSPENQQAGGAVLTREEYQTRVDDFAPEPESAAEGLSGLRGSLDPGDLSPLFSTTGTRTIFQVKWRGSTIAVSIDDGHYATLRGRARQRSLHELELELVRGDVDALLDLAERLNGRYAIRQTLFSKADIGYHLASSVFRLRPVKWKRYDDGTPLHTLKAQLGRSLSHFLINDPLLLHDRLGAIHQSRVGLRRARAVLRAHKRRIDYLQRKGLNGELKWLQEQLGAARDWQVFENEVFPRLKLDDDSTSEIAVFARRQTRVRLDEAMLQYGSRRARRLILMMQRWTAALEENAKADRKARGRVFMKDLRNLLDAGRFPPASRPDDIHAIRILGKKLRYVFEMSPELDSPLMKETHRALRSMQDQLGRYNDLARAMELFASAPSSELSPRAFTALRREISKQQVRVHGRMKPRYARLRGLARQLLLEMEAGG